MLNAITLDNSNRSTFRQCKRKYFYQVINGLQTNFGSTAIRYGVAWHGIQEGYHSYIKEHGWPVTPEEKTAAIVAGINLGKEKWEKESADRTYYEDFKNFNTAVEAFGEYLDFFKDDSRFINILATEQKFICPIIPHNSTEEKLMKGLPEINFTGRVDLCVEMDGMNWLFDFKTTGWRLDEVISKANRSPQLIGYSYAGKECFDFDPDGCLLSFAHISARKSPKTEMWGTVKHTFRRVPQIFTEADINSWKLSFIDTVIDLIRCYETNSWAESFDNCFQYGTCPYLKLCRQSASAEPILEIKNFNTEEFHVDFWDVLED